MEFWGAEVKPGKSLSCHPGDEYVIHISQAALGETKKGNENVALSVKVDDKKMIIATLSSDKHPQSSCDLIFEKKFELSHNSKTASVFLCGYKTYLPAPYESDSGEDEDEEEEIPKINDVIDKSEGKAAVKNGEKTKQAEDDSKAKQVEDDSDDSDDDLLSSSDDEMSEDDSSDNDSSDDSAPSLKLSSTESSDSSDDDSSDEEDEEPSKKHETGKKRTAVTTFNTPASDKKAKIATPSGQKTGDRKVAHVATPHPSKQVGKTPANSKPREKAPKSEKTPKSANTHACKSCGKTFGSNAALQSHEKSKHVAK